MKKSTTHIREVVRRAYTEIVLIYLLKNKQATTGIVASLLGVGKSRATKFLYRLADVSLLEKVVHGVWKLNPSLVDLIGRTWEVGGLSVEPKTFIVTKNPSGGIEFYWLYSGGGVDKLEKFGCFSRMAEIDFYAKVSVDQSRNSWWAWLRKGLSVFTHTPKGA